MKSQEEQVMRVSSVQMLDLLLIANLFFYLKLHNLHLPLLNQNFIKFKNIKNKEEAIS